MSYEAPAGLSAGMIMLPGRGGAASCLLEHTFAMHHCLSRETAEAGVPAALLALLQPAAEAARARECARQQAPPCAAAMQGSHNFSVLSPRLLAPLADLRPGDFAVHLAGCVGRRERPRPLRQCEAKLAALANLSRARGSAEGPLQHAQAHGGAEGPHSHAHDPKRS